MIIKECDNCDALVPDDELTRSDQGKFCRDCTRPPFDSPQDARGSHDLSNSPSYRVAMINSGRGHLLP